MELELGLALPTQDRYKNRKSSKKNSAWNFIKERFVCDGIDDDDEVESKDSSLLVWSGQPSDNHGGRKSGFGHANEVENHEEKDEDVVGWPPINSWRKEVLHRNHGGGAAAAVPPARNSMFVKVKMAGVPIGRKIDLARFDSYEALTHSLITMFGKYTKNEMREGDYTILYQDNEGDWLLTGDVPWEIFVETVHRMEIQRNA